MKAFVGGVAIAEMYKGDQLIAVAKTLTTSSMTVSVTAEEVRAGKGAGLIGRYFHTPKLDLSLVDATFNLAYIASNVGGNIIIGGDVTATEQITLDGSGEGTIDGTPATIDNYGTIGWISILGEDDWQKITFSSQTFTYSSYANKTVCVKYMTTDDSAKILTVPANIVPDEVKLILKADLFKAGSSASTSSKLGNVEIEVPRFGLNGNAEITMEMGGTSTTPLSGTALVADDASCTDGSGQLAKIKQIEFGAKWYDSVYALAIVDDTITVSTANSTATLDVRAIPSMGSAFKPSYSDLTFTSSDATKATVSSSGVVTKVATGNCVITVVITNKNTVSATANITVS